MAGRSWRIRLSATAELDFANIVKWTAETFGERQSRLDADAIFRAIGALSEGPAVLGSKSREEIRPGLRTLHIARDGRRGRHLLLYRATSGQIIEIVRVLHDQMELERYLPPDDEDSGW